jgi:hypothetical protein
MWDGKMHVTKKVVTIFFTILLLSAPFPCRGDDRPIDGITDNSFLIEEAYNQEEGVIQHIFSALYTNDSRHRGWSFTFTQEWPVFSEDHQFSFTIPSSHLRDEEQRQNGIGDVLLNYRYQSFKEGENVPAFAPRFSLILPTGSRDKGTGNGVVGYQWNLPFSKKIASRLALHANLGLTYLPKVRVPLDLPGDPLSPKHSLVSYNVGASAIYAFSSRVNVMLEWLGFAKESLNGQGKRIREFKSTLSPGIRSSVIDKEEFQSVIGVALPVGLNRAAENFGVFLYLSIEHKIF